MCTNTIGNQLLQCMTCLVAIDPAHQSSEQSDINSWNKACNGSLSLGSGSSSGGNSSGTTNGTTGGTTSGTTDGTAPSTTTGGSSSGSNPSGSEVGGATGLKIGGVAVCILAALAGAYISL
ncbi:hypothetical protein OG21DRAFT_1510653 [Imleria badia]|nr:hypothetical protein OG21DRAFT_1510653 [Imleria badia]